MKTFKILVICKLNVILSVQFQKPGAYVTMQLYGKFMGMQQWELMR